MSGAGSAGRHHRTAMCSGSFQVGHPMHGHRTPPQQPVLTEGAKFTQQKNHTSGALQQQCRCPEPHVIPTIELLATTPSKLGYSLSLGSLSTAWCTGVSLMLWSVSSATFNYSGQKSYPLIPPCPSAGICHSASPADRIELIQPTAPMVHNLMDYCKLNWSELNHLQLLQQTPPGITTLHP